MVKKIIIPLFLRFGEPNKAYFWPNPNLPFPRNPSISRKGTVSEIMPELVWVFTKKWKKPIPASKNWEFKFKCESRWNIRFRVKFMVFMSSIHQANRGFVAAFNKLPAQSCLDAEHPMECDDGNRRPLRLWNNSWLMLAIFVSCFWILDISWYILQKHVFQLDNIVIYSNLN
jgi:hypothetical protein